MNESIDNISFPLNHLQDSIDKLALSSYRRGLLDAATVCRLRGELVGVDTVYAIKIREAHLADASALLDLAQNLTVLPKP